MQNAGVKTDRITAKMKSAQQIIIYQPLVIIARSPHSSERPIAGPL